ncbi:SRPBCC family protein [Chloroflexota bacterium]
MARIDKEVTVNAPIEKIFNYISEPSNLPEFWPSLMEIKNVQSLPNGGYSAQWVYKMAGMRFKGAGEYTKIVPNQYFVIEVKGGIRSTITWTFRSRRDITRVTLTIEYKVPIPLLGKLAEAIIVKMNDQEGDLIMANLQARFMIANQ